VKRIISVGYELKALSNLIKRYIYNSHSKENIDRFSEIQGMLIGYLNKNSHKDIFQKDIEEAFTIRRSTVTGILQSMEKNEYITRESVPYDARLKKIVLTEKGRDIHNHIMNEIDKFEKRITQNISDEELEMFAKILDKFKKNLE
jgi:MarR family transcriptional regulator, repressor for mepA